MRTQMLKVMVMIIVVAVLGGCSMIEPMLECCLESQKIVAYYVEEPPSDADPADYLVNWVEYHPYAVRCIGWPDHPTEGKHIECIAIYDMDDPQEICAAREFLGVPLDEPVWTPEGQPIYPPCN